jgi:Ca-activated chloride channel family protein
MTAAIQTAGLLVARREVEGTAAPTIPLTGVAVRARVTSTASRVTVSQSYRNTEPQPLEAVYVFPLEEGSAVCGFAVTIDGRRLTGVVKPREQAFGEYDDAMAEGHGAFLLDEERPNIFTASVGNLMPGQEVEVELSYVAELVPEGDGVRLTIPTTVSPRYVPQHRRDFDGLDDADRVSPPSSTDPLPYRLDLQVEADLLAPVTSVDSPSHRIRTEIDGTKVTVSLSGDEGALDRDFVLVLQTAEPFEPSARIVAGAGGERFAVASFRPRFEARRVPIEAIFLIDCSGSMTGASIADAKRTLLLCLRSLEEGDTFDVVRFGSTHEHLFGKARPFNQTNLAEADALVRSMDADLGGTEILSPLQDVLKRRPAKGRRRRIVLLTDGQVSNEDEVIELARSHSRTTRFFTFGLGAGASDHLVRGVARAGGGASEMVAPGERIEPKVLRHVRRMGLEHAEKVRLEWTGLEVRDATPAALPELVPGEILTVIASVVDGRSGEARLVFEIGGREFQLACPVAPSAAADDVIPALWARRRIRELEEGGDVRGSRGSQQKGRTRARSERARDEADAELEMLGCRYGLLSRATSYVVIDERAEGERATETAELRRIPVALTSGWGGLSLGAPSALARHHSWLPSLRMCLEVRSDPAPSLLSPFESLHDAPEHWPPAAPAPAGPKSDLDRAMDLIILQNADGSWDLTDELARAVGIPLDQLERAASGIAAKDAGRFLATAIVLACAEDGTIPVDDAWRHLLEKATRWLTKATRTQNPPDGHSTWLDWARMTTGMPNKG